MKNHALLSYCYACILGIFVFPTMAQAQDTPNSPWTISAEMGFSVITSCNECDPSNIIDIPPTSENTMSYQLVGSQVSLRAERWFGITGHLGMGGLRVQSTKVLGDNSGWARPGYPVQRNVAVNSLFLTIGPQFFLRIGQGDLGLEFRSGIAMHTARVKATGFQGEGFDIKYKPVFRRALAWRLGYTFWPQGKFGIRTAIGFSDTGDGSQDYFQPRTQIDLGSLEQNLETLERLHPRTDGAASLHFLLGITYRL